MIDVIITGDGLLGFFGAIIGVIGAYSLASWQSKSEIRNRFDILLFKSEKHSNIFANTSYILQKTNFERLFLEVNESFKEIEAELDTISPLLPSGIYKSGAFEKYYKFYSDFNDDFKRRITEQRKIGLTTSWCYSDDYDSSVFHRQLIGEINQLRRMNHSFLYRIFYKIWQRIKYRNALG